MVGVRPHLCQTLFCAALERSRFVVDAAHLAPPLVVDLAQVKKIRTSSNAHQDAPYKAQSMYTLSYMGYTGMHSSTNKKNGAC